MNTPIDRPPGKIAIAALRIFATVQIMYGLFLSGLRFIDLHKTPEVPSGVANLPFVVMGAPFLFIAWALWHRRRWGLWLGLAHSALLPVTIVVVSSFLPMRGGGAAGPSNEGLGLAVLILFVLPLYLLNVVGFALLLAIPRARRSFEGHDGSWSQWSLRSVLAVTLLAPPLLTVDYTIPRQRSARSKAEQSRRQEAIKRLHEATKRFALALQHEDVDFADAKRLILEQDRLELWNCEPLLEYQDKRVRLETIQLLLESGIYNYRLEPFIEDPNQDPQVRVALLRLRAAYLGYSEEIRDMHNPLLSDDARKKAAELVLAGSDYDRHSYLVDTLLAFDADRAKSVDALALASSDRQNLASGHDRRALEAMLELNGPPAHAVAAVRRCLDKHAYNVDEMAALLLVRWDVQDDRNVPALIRLVRRAIPPSSSQREIEYSRMAIDALATMGPQG